MWDVEGSREERGGCVRGEGGSRCGMWRVAERREVGV